jgi:gliding motility-associated lipoprotein GldH
MKRLIILFALAYCISACDDSRVFEKNVDFDERFWLVNNTPEFEFEITDTSTNYNLYCNIRNSLSFPFSQMYLDYTLTDSTGAPVQKKMIEAYLFEKSGKPQGNSGLGDIYDQRIPLLQNFHFANPGLYKVRFEQKMRTDSLQGVLAVGLRVEKFVPSK